MRIKDKLIHLLGGFTKDDMPYQMPKIMKLADDICKAVIWGDEE